MYRNPGHKIMLIAKVWRWVLFGALEAVGLAGLITAAGGLWQMIAAAALMAAAPLLAWLSSLLLYAAGHLVENSDIRTDLAVRGFRAMSAAPAAFPQGTPPAGFAPGAQANPEYYAAAPGYTGTPYPVEGTDSPYYGR